MSRLLATVRLDLRLQFRNGFYYAVAFVLVCWIVVLTQLPTIDWGYLFPPLVLGNLSMVSFYFIGGLVLLEKGEGTLEAQIITPLDDREYLASKVITLTALSLIENVVIVAMAYGMPRDPLALAAGITLAAVIYSLLGFVVVARYDSINEYIFPSVVYVTALSLPFLSYFELWASWLMYLHPLQAPLILMKAAFQPIEPWQWVYGLFYPALWIGPLFVWCRRTFRRFVIASEGVR